MLMIDSIENAAQTKLDAVFDQGTPMQAGFSSTFWSEIERSLPRSPGANNG